ncbi:hypothetical protein TXIAM_250075 [Tenacibaculum xiamenense]
MRNLFRLDSFKVVMVIKNSYLCLVGYSELIGGGYNMFQKTKD